jgi:hypothetical protein
LNKPGTRDAGFPRGGDDDDRLEHLRSSANLNYLLEDDEEPKRGWGKLILILLAIALAGGFGYLHWKQGGFDWLTAAYKKTAQAQPSAPDTQSSTGNGNAVADTPAGAPPAATAPASVPSGTAAPTTPAAASTAPPANNAEQQGVPATAPPQSSPATTSQDNSSSNSSTTPTPTGGSQTSTAEPPAPPDAAASGSATSPSAPAPSSDQGQQPAPVPVPAATAKSAVPKPSPAKAADSVVEAQRYIYGRGVHQDCDHGLRMLKSAADRSDTKAMISLGALYSTGTCAPRDLPTAYRWFAGALHKDPENQALQDDLQKLWSQMTQPERQLAIKLSQ